MNTKQLLAQHIPLLDLHRRHLIRITRMASRNYSAVAVPIIGRRLRSFLATVEATCPVEHSAAHRCLLSTECR